MHVAQAQHHAARTRSAEAGERLQQRRGSHEGGAGEQAPARLGVQQEPRGATAALRRLVGGWWAVSGRLAGGWRAVGRGDRFAHLDVGRRDGLQKVRAARCGGRQVRRGGVSHCGTARPCDSMHAARSTQRGASLLAGRAPWRGTPRQRRKHGLKHVVGRRRAQQEARRSCYSCSVIKFEGRTVAPAASGAQTSGSALPSPSKSTRLSAHAAARLANSSLRTSETGCMLTWQQSAR
jgi:hypothetical protein